MKPEELKPGVRVIGIGNQPVSIIAVEPAGDMYNVVYRDAVGQIADRLISADDLEKIQVDVAIRCTFDGDGNGFRLASEARRIELAQLFDPFAAVQTATILQ